MPNLPPMCQYFTPDGPYFVGDCMPFWHDGVFHLYWLLDEDHHRGGGGLGYHQWAHASTRDLVHWEHHPLALGIDADWEGSICTGSLLWHEGTYYAFYAVRRPDWSQHFHLATSPDGVHFTKLGPEPMLSPPEGYAPEHFRDPVCFRDPATGLFHVLITAERRDPPALRGGCLAHLTSPDLREWTVQEPFLFPGFHDVPECPDYFHWNGWYYLVFSNDGVARYRMSREPFGPWLTPPVDSFDGPMARVLKTAAFGPDRRLGLAFLPSLDGDRDAGGWLYAGNAVFREIIQHPDGTLGTTFPREMTPFGGAALELPVTALTPGVTITGEGVTLDATDGFGAAVLEPVPADFHLTVTLTPQGPVAAYGLGLRGRGDYEAGYELRLSPTLQQVDLRPVGARSLHHDPGRTLRAVEGLQEPVQLEVICQGDIIDVCVGGRRTLVTRLPEQRGDRLFLFCQHGAVVLSELVIRPLLQRK